MAKRKAQPAVTDYIKAMYTTAQKLGYSIESITETISDKSNNVTSRIITGYRLTRKDIQFVANVEKNTALSSLQQVAKALIDKMHSIPTRLGDITVSESTESNAMEGQKEEAKEKESKAIKVQITPQATNYMDMKHQHNEDKSLAYQEEKQATREEKTEGGYSWAKVGSTVYNKRNGVGIIDSIDGIIMQVKFQKETKRYIYPDAILDGLLKKGKRQTDVSMVSSLPETVLKRKELNNPEADLSEDNTIYDKAQLGAESLTKYLLTDESCVRNRVCPKCKYTLWLKRYNIPVYDRTGKFISYYVDKLHWCPTCKVVYMTEETFMRIQNRVLKGRKYIRPSNIRTMVKKHPERYLSDPILSNGFEVDTRSETQGYEGQQIYNLASSSFLSDEGYSVSVPMTERHEKLNSAIQKYGKRRVTDHLRFLIRTRQGQKEGREKFANAISIWTDDLNYVLNL